MQLAMPHGKWGLAVRYELVTTRSESQAAFEILRDGFGRGASVFRDHSLGWQSGSGQFEVFWRGELDLWGVFETKPPKEKNPGRFWNCFGVANPERNAMLHITAEINPPHEGVNNRTGGLFLRDEEGRLYLGHKGKIGGGRRGIGRKAFREFYKSGDWIEIESPMGLVEVARVFGPFGDLEMPAQLAEYVHKIAEFKERVVLGTV